MMSCVALSQLFSMSNTLRSSGAPITQHTSVRIPTQERARRLTFKERYIYLLMYLSVLALPRSSPRACGRHHFRAQKCSNVYAVAYEVLHTYNR